MPDFLGLGEAEWEGSGPVSALSPLIGPVSSRPRADELVQRITEAIHLGLLNDGEQLPVEVELAAPVRGGPDDRPGCPGRALRDAAWSRPAADAAAARS